MDTSYLDQRFADIAARIEQSLAKMRPENALMSLGRRFDSLETQLNAVLGHVATRADLEEMRAAEAQIEDIGNQLNQFRRQLARLDVIDAHLGTLTSQLSDERLTRLFNEGVQVTADVGRLDAIDAQLRMIAVQLSDERLSGLVSRSSARDDYEDLANSAALRAAANFADGNFTSAQSRDIGEVRGMLESLINERRHNDENNASMLETMQQAIIRVLDRIDALEITQQAAPAIAAAPAPASAPVRYEMPALAAHYQSAAPAMASPHPQRRRWTTSCRRRRASMPKCPQSRITRTSFPRRRRLPRTPTSTPTTRMPSSSMLRRACPSTQRPASTWKPPSPARATLRPRPSASRSRRSARWKCCATTSSPMRTAPS